MVRRLAYFLIAFCIVLAIPFSIVELPDWLLLIGLFGGRLYILSIDPLLQNDRRMFWASVILWGVVHVIVSVVDAPARAFIGLPLLSLPLIYWLMSRFSNITEQWMNLSFRVTTILMGIAGWFLTHLGESELGAFAIPICILIVASHTYRAFSDRNDNRTLTAHWVALAILLWIGAGLLAAMVLFMSAGYWVRDTLILTVLKEWMRYATLAVILAMGNQITADIRGENRRVTGLSAYWLFAFGVIIGRLVMVYAGILQLSPLHQFEPSPAAINEWFRLIWLAGFWNIAILLGLIIYAVQIFIRRPPGLLSLNSEPCLPHSPSPHSESE